MSFCCVRIDKIKTTVHLMNAAAEIGRTKEVKNADPRLKEANQVLVHSNDVNEEWKAIVGPQKVRSDAVLAHQVTLIRSADWTGNEEEWVTASERWLYGLYGKSNVLLCVVHRDETTPHIQALVVPVDPVGKLNGKFYTGNKHKLSAIQTTYARAVEHLGLQRGQEGSLADHGDIRDYYASIKRAKDGTPAAPRKIMGMVSGKVADILHADALAAQVAMRAAEKERDVAIDRAIKAEKKLKETSEELEAEREKAKRLRGIDLSLVAESLGAERDPRDKQKWKLPSGVTVSLQKEGPLYHNFADGKGGRGAIDLVKLALNSDYKGAVSWLASTFGDDMAEQDIRLNSTAPRAVVADALKTPPPPSPAPPAVEKNWGYVRDYLLRVRRLGADLVDALHAAGSIYADARRNFVALHSGPNGTKGGCEIRGTGEARFCGGSSPKLGFLVRGVRAGLVVVESAIDAISCCQMTGMSAVSLGGAGLNAALEWVRAWGGQGTVYAGHDVDEAGIAQSNRLMDIARKEGLNMVRLPPCDKELMPIEGKDWNEALVQKTKEEEEEEMEVIVLPFTGDSPPLLPLPIERRMTKEKPKLPKQPQIKPPQMKGPRR